MGGWEERRTLAETSKGLDAGVMCEDGLSQEFWGFGLRVFGLHI